MSGISDPLARSNSREMKSCCNAHRDVTIRQCSIKRRFPAGYSNCAVCLDQLKVLRVQYHFSQNSYELYRLPFDTENFWLVQFVASGIIGNGLFEGAGHLNHQPTECRRL